MNRNRISRKGFQLVYGSTANLFIDRGGDYIGYGATLGTWYFDGRKPDEITTVTAAAAGVPVDEQSVTIARYGDWISYKPSAAPVLWPLWAAPILLILAGLIVAWRRLRRRRAL